MRMWPMRTISIEKCLTIAAVTRIISKMVPVLMYIANDLDRLTHVTHHNSQIEEFCMDSEAEKGSWHL